MTRTWPDDWHERKRGDGCGICRRGRPDETRGGVRFLVGDHADAYLRRRPMLPGQAIVVWHGRHVADPIELSGEECAGYFADLCAAARLLESAFSPAHVNYLTFGNAVPHLHTYVTLRYLNDPSPGAPLDPSVQTEVPPEEFEDQVRRLRAAASRS